MTESVENKSADLLKGIQLPEELRCQYLNVMGIQTWFDPELTNENSEPLEETVSDTVTERARNLPSSELSKTPSKKPEVNSPEKKLTDIPAVENFESTVSVNSLHELNLSISQCELCELHTNRHQAVAGEGDVSARLFIITDAPIDDNAGENALLSMKHKKMLQAMLETINCSLSDVFVTSLVKCKPAEQRLPQTSEMICCDDHLSAQIKLVQPNVIMVLGELASQQLLVSQKSLTDLRLRQHKHLGIPVYASYHPVAMFNSSETKRKVWADLLQISNHIQ